MWAYSIKLVKDDNGTFLVTCPAFPEVTTFGEDEEAVRRHALVAIKEAIAARMADREPIPAPLRTKAEYRLTLPAQAVAKMMLYQKMLDKNVSKSALARSLKRHRPEVDRLLNLQHSSRLDIMEQAFGALGARMRIEIENEPEDDRIVACG